jgi:WD40 repeat protein
MRSQLARVVLQGHTAEVYSLAFTPDRTRLLSGSDDGSPRIFFKASRHPLLPDHPQREPGGTEMPSDGD